MALTFFGANPPRPSSLVPPSLLSSFAKERERREGGKEGGREGSKEKKRVGSGLTLSFETKVTVGIITIWVCFKNKFVRIHSLKVQEHVQKRIAHPS
jgi:hypothetical protein